MTPSKPVRSEVEMMAAAPISITLAGRPYAVQPLGFGAACLWLEKAGALELELKEAFPEGSLDERGRATSPEVAARLMRIFPKVEELVFDYMDLDGEMRNALDRELGSNVDAAMGEVMAAYLEVAATANPTKAAQFRQAKALMTTPTPAKRPGGRKSR